MATGTGNLPNPSMAFTPFDILLAEELNDLVENIEALATGSGIGDGAIGTSDLANAAVTSQKVDFTTFNQIFTSTARTVSSSTPQTLATITVPTAGTYRLRSNIVYNDNGVAGQADVVFNLSVNGSSAGGSGDFITSQSSSYNMSHEFEREFTWSTGTILLQAYRNTGSKSLSIIGSRQIYVERVG